MRYRSFTLSVVFLCFSAASTWAAKLKEVTLDSWNHYVSLTEARIDEELSSPSGFLVHDFLDPAEAAQIRSAIRSGIFVRKMTTRNPEGGEVKIPDGLVHHWYATVRVPRAKLEDVIAWVQDYDRHHEYYDEVEDSRLIERKGDVFDIFLRLKRKKVITVHYNTNHSVAYRRLSPERMASRSESTHIAELEDPGSSREKEKSPDADRGFLWRLNSYWRFAQEGDGVVVECESVSLSRTIPVAFRWIVKPFINSVPKESLEATLLPLRTAIAGAGP